jgi:hypothetical protein
MTVCVLFAKEFGWTIEYTEELSLDEVTKICTILSELNEPPKKPQEQQNIRSSKDGMSFGIPENQREMAEKYGLI